MSQGKLILQRNKALKEAARLTRKDRRRSVYVAELEKRLRDVETLAWRALSDATLAEARTGIRAHFDRYRLPTIARLEANKAKRAVQPVQRPAVSADPIDLINQRLHGIAGRPPPKAIRDTGRRSQD